MALVSVDYGSQLAVIATEHSLSQQTEKIGVYVLLVDTALMQSGDTVVCRIKTKRHLGDSARIAYSYSFSDVQPDPNKYSVPVPVDTEIICTLQQTAGTARTFPWKLLRA